MISNVVLDDDTLDGKSRAFETEQRQQFDPSRALKRETAQVQNDGRIVFFDKLSRKAAG